MAQGVLGFQIEEEKGSGAVTGMVGMLPLLDFAVVAGLLKAIRRFVGLRDGGKGYSDAQQILSLILLNVAGGECMRDLAMLAADVGLVRQMEQALLSGLTGRERRKLRRRLQQFPGVPSHFAMADYLAEFHDEEQEKLRQPKQALIIEPTAALEGLWKVNEQLLAFGQQRAAHRVATLDMDATLVETHKDTALYCYKKMKAYQPLNVFWDEQQTMVSSQFRDGNVPAGFRQVEVLESALAALPVGVEKVLVRADSAGYEHELMAYCAEGKNKRFGKLEFAVSVDMTGAFKEAVRRDRVTKWRPVIQVDEVGEVVTGQEWAEVNFVPKELARKKKGPLYRYVAIREPLRQLTLPGMEEEQQQSLPVPTMDFEQEGRFKLRGVVTNRWDLGGNELIQWHRGRCGKSEEVHAVLKRDLAGGRMPSTKFGANAGWWAASVLTFNLISLFKQLVLGGQWVPQRLKGLRLKLFNVAARVVRHAGEIVFRLRQGHPSLSWLVAARHRVLELARASPG